MTLALLCGVLSAVLFVGIWFAPSFGAWAITTRGHKLVVAAASHLAMTALALATVTAVLVGLVAGFVTLSPGQDHSATSTLQNLSVVTLWFALLFLYGIWRMRMGLVRARPELRAAFDKGRRLPYRPRPTGPPLASQVWEHHIAASTATPELLDAAGLSSSGPGVAQRAHNAHVQGRSQSLARRDLLARRVMIAFLAVIVVATLIDGALPDDLVLLDLTRYMSEGALVAIIAAAVAGMAGIVGWAYSWRLDRWTGQLSKPHAAHGAYVSLPEVREATTTAEAGHDANLPAVLRRCALAMTTDGANSTLNALLALPLTAIDVQLRTVAEISTFRCSLVVDNPHPDAPLYHRAAGAVLAHPLGHSQYIACIPSGFTDGRVKEVRIESHDYEERFSTVTSSPRTAQALLNPRTVEWILALPDDVAVVFFGELVVTVALTTIDAFALPAMESAAVAAVVYAPEYPTTDPLPRRRVERPRHEPVQPAAAATADKRGAVDSRSGAAPAATVLPRNGRSDQ